MTKTFIKIGAMQYNAADYSIPADRTFRQAWTAGPTPEDGVISVDMPRAREIWRDKIRLAREAEFARLDAEFIRTLETGADTSAIVKKKQALRDAPNDLAIDAANTPDELRAVQPAGLTVK